MMSEADINHVRGALVSLDLLVVQDLFLTEAAQMADFVLPAAAFAEKEGTFTNTERRIQRIRKALEPPGEALPDWEIIADISRRLGCPVPYRSSSEIMEEIARLTPICGGVSYGRLERGGLQWPCWDRDHPGTRTLHQEGLSRGKGKFHVAHDRPPAELPSGACPLLLTAGRILEHWHTGSMSHRSRVLEALAPESRVEISPADATRLGIEDGDLISLSSRRGRVKTRARKTPVMEFTAALGPALCPVPPLLSYPTEHQHGRQHHDRPKEECNPWAQICQGVPYRRPDEIPEVAEGPYYPYRRPGVEWANSRGLNDHCGEDRVVPVPYEAEEDHRNPYYLPLHYGYHSQTDQTDNQGRHEYQSSGTQSAREKRQRYRGQHTGGVECCQGTV